MPRATCAGTRATHVAVPRPAPSAPRAGSGAISPSIERARLHDVCRLVKATRLQRKGFETSILLYGPGVTLGVQRGFPTLGDEAFPGHRNFNKQLVKFMEEGGEVYCCRFALQALYGHGEPSLIEGIIPISPLDVLDLNLIHRREGSFVMQTWTV